ncbi:cobalamin-5'-phosphate synthase [Alkalithermobacter thermoalcaliphilus JW-YL-7 = DSM 7308]|uniref:Adenosylcobinamide-GDP ribazoletransferase n=1 Tax=Alkalithermobacter thermoalcaliphilus JW-YL-7 = DSM 7308 TaxID=1121328 RepID=A0A150FMU1_CLOPD|nr:Cobalamin synthase [[Clostridium] paradoxum JW-YL-7 = DSM 7308]SHL21145.1 cobalamin-5'-phosphate synthase [[Clostridium] paradoxum JW-YL-7 = DSM 7308]
MKRFIGILQFLTRIPIKIDIGFDEEFEKSIIYFPLVGLILGSIYLLITYISLNIFNIYISSVIFLLSEVILTGGLHLDGLGDTFDGIYSYTDKEKILQIMKDSRLGTNALLAILFLILLKLAFVYSIIQKNILYPIVIVPVVGRLSIVFACYKNTTPREKGMGNIFIGKTTNYQLLMSIIQSILIIAFLILDTYELIFNILFIFILWIFVRLFTRYITSKIDGITGDILGCCCEISQLLYLIFLYLALNI